MGKSSSKPSYSSGSVKINGKEIASVTKDDNGYIKGQYNMSKADKKIYDNVQSNLNKSLKNLFKISDSTKKQWDQQLSAYKQSGIDEINSIYEPMQLSLKNDIAGRFGNLDNSVFLDKLSSITDNKAKAVSALSDSVTMKQDELYSNELKNRMNYISLLNGVYTGYNNQIMNYLNMAKANADSGNNYNSQMYSKSNDSWSGLGTFANAATSLFF
jgi:hypothetical protein